MPSTQSGSCSDAGTEANPNSCPYIAATAGPKPGTFAYSPTRYWHWRVVDTTGTEVLLETFPCRGHGSRHCPLCRERSFSSIVSIRADTCNR